MLGDGNAPLIMIANAVCSNAECRYEAHYADCRYAECGKEAILLTFIMLSAAI
jgi:hypothetical protein